MQVCRVIDRMEHSRALVLVAAQLLGMYVVSTILMLRLSLPVHNRPLITELLPGIEFDFFERWFDGLYVCSALTSILFIYAKRVGNKTFGE